MINIIKKILYVVMVVVIVTAAVYSYNRVQFGRNLAMLYRLATGNTAMGGPGGAPPGGDQRGMGPGGERGMPPDGQQRGGPQGQPPQQMGQDMPGGQQGFQPPQRGQDMPGGQQGPQRPQMQGGREGGAPPDGRGPGGPQNSWYKMNVRNILPYTCIMAFFVLITYVVDKSIKRMFR